MSTVFSLISAIFMVAVVVFYFRQVYNSQSTPNPATWLVWIVVMSLNTATYYFVTGGRLLLVITPSVIIVGMVAIMIYATKVGRIGKISQVDVICLVLATVIGIFWQVSKNSTVSNLMLQLVFLISYIPTIVGLAKGRLKEKPLAWNLAVTSYVFLILSVLSSGEWTVTQLAYPIVNGIVGNGSVPIILWWKKQQRKGEVR